MKIETSKFKKALDIVKPALAGKEIIEQTTSFAFIEGNVVTYNDEICITQPLEGVAIDGVIKAEELYKFLTKVKEKEFDINVTDSEVVMKAGRAKVGFALNKEILLPLGEEISEKGDWKDLPSTFLQACKFAVASASTDMSDPKLTCIHIVKTGVIEATNNYRLVIWTLGTAIPIPTTLIPATSIREVIKIQPTKVSKGNGWVHFKNESGTVISCRVFDEKFVNTSAIMKDIGKVKKMVFPDGLLQILEKAEVFTQEQKTDGSVTIEIKDGKLTVKSESTTAWFKEALPYDGEEQFAFSITPYLLKDILKQTNECSYNKNVLKFEGEQWLYVTGLRSGLEE
jgi:DNA polymerase III sliding clamp (beta) subunit (PCNA family)